MKYVYPRNNKKLLDKYISICAKEKNYDGFNETNIYFLSVHPMWLKLRRNQLCMINNKIGMLRILKIR